MAFVKSPSVVRVATISAIIVATLVVVLRLLGRRWWCACGGFELWADDVHGPHMSQHLVDPYAFTHALHGLLLYGACAWLVPRLPLAWRFVVSLAETPETKFSSIPKSKPVTLHGPSQAAGSPF